MRPVRTGASNDVYRGPSPDVGDLWVQRVRPGEIRSVWELDDDERRLIADGGRIELAIFNEPIPPVSLIVLPEATCRPTAENPHRIPSEEAAEARRRG